MIRKYMFICFAILISGSAMAYELSSAINTPEPETFRLSSDLGMLSSDLGMLSSDLGMLS